MTDHDGWDHHDPGHGEHPDDFAPHPGDVPPEDDLTHDDHWNEPFAAEPDHDADVLHEYHAEVPHEHHAEEQHEYHAEQPAEPAGPQPIPDQVVGADPDAVPDLADPVQVFPQILDVGPLPEPMDGFPWIDTGSLGAAGPQPVSAETLQPVTAETPQPVTGETPDPRELAEYAGVDLPGGQDPWAALADSDDPAVSALARYYSRPDA